MWILVPWKCLPMFEKSNNCHSPGNQALASIYLGEIEVSWAKYKKHFTLAPLAPQNSLPTILQASQDHLTSHSPTQTGSISLEVAMVMGVVIVVVMIPQTP